jgi:hypothetical protein
MQKSRAVSKAIEQEQTEITEQHFSVPSVAARLKHIVDIDWSWLFLGLITKWAGA